jgi:hypothetical protein
VLNPSECNLHGNHKHYQSAILLAQGYSFFFHVQEALKRKLKARMEYAKFLQDTAKEMAKEVQTSRSGETKQTAEDLDEFLNKV